MEESDDRWFLLDGRKISSWAEISHIQTIAWIDQDLVVLNGHDRLFFYRISNDTLTLVDDMSDWMAKYGKSQVYYGIADMMPTKNGCFYFAHKNEEKSNIVGTVWYADETGIKVLFDGQEFNRVAYENGMLLLIGWDGNRGANQIGTTHLWYANDDDLTLRKKAIWDGIFDVRRMANGYIMISQNEEPYRFYVMDTSDTTLSSYVPRIKNCWQYNFLGIRKDGDSLQYIYSSFIDGVAAYYLYDTQTDTNLALNSKLFLFNDEALHKPMTHFVERYPNESYDDMFYTTGVRIREID